MPLQENIVQLLINGKRFAYWESIQISSELNTLARTFNLTTTKKLPLSANFFDDFKPGSDVKVYIGNDLVLTGYLDQLPLQYDANNIRAQLVGRSRTSDLVDCCQAPQSYTIDLNKGGWSSTPHLVKSGYTKINVTETKAKRAWNKAKVVDVIATMIAPYGIALKVEDSILAKLQGVADNSYKPEDLILNILKNLVKDNNLLLHDDEYGDLVIDKKQDEIKTKSNLTLGENIISANAPFNSTELFRDYEFIGAQKGSNGKGGADICNSQGFYTDNDIIKRQRYFCKKNDNQADSDKCSEGAKGEALYRKSNYYKVTYVVTGWRKSDGTLWKINEVVPVNDSVMGFNNLKMLVTKVDFNLTNDGGLLTTLDLVPPDGYRNDDQKKEDVKQTKISSSNTNSSNDLGLVSADGTIK